MNCVKYAPKAEGAMDTELKEIISLKYEIKIGNLHKEKGIIFIKNQIEILKLNTLAEMKSSLEGGQYPRRTF